METLTNAGVLVTGAGRGIGKRLAIGFATAGNRVALLARSKAELDLAHLEIEHAGGNALRIRADVTDFEQVNAAVDRMRVHYGEVHVLICAAAIPGPIGPFVDQSPKAWIDTIQTNLLGVMNACKAVLPHMIERRYGKIIVLSGPGATWRARISPPTPRPKPPSSGWWRPSPKKFATTTSKSTAWGRAAPTRI